MTVQGFNTGCLFSLGFVCFGFPAFLISAFCFLLSTCCSSLFAFLLLLAFCVLPSACCFLFFCFLRCSLLLASSLLLFVACFLLFALSFLLPWRESPHQALLGVNKIRTGYDYRVCFSNRLLVRKHASPFSIVLHHHSSSCHHSSPFHNVHVLLSICCPLDITAVVVIVTQTATAIV